MVTSACSVVQVMVLLAAAYVSPVALVVSCAWHLLLEATVEAAVRCVSRPASVILARVAVWLSVLVLLRVAAVVI